MDKALLTQVGEALARLGVEHIPSCSPSVPSHARSVGASSGSSPICTTGLHLQNPRTPRPQPARAAKPPGGPRGGARAG